MDDWLTGLAFSDLTLTSVVLGLSPVHGNVWGLSESLYYSHFVLTSQRRSRQKGPEKSTEKYFYDLNKLV